MAFRIQRFDFKSTNKLQLVSGILISLAQRGTAPEIPLVFDLKLHEKVSTLHSKNSRVKPESVKVTISSHYVTIFG